MNAAMPVQENILVLFDEPSRNLEDIPLVYQSSLIKDAVVNYSNAGDGFILSQSFLDKFFDCCYVKVETSSPIEMELRSGGRSLLFVAVFEGDISFLDNLGSCIELDGGSYCFVGMEVGRKMVELNATTSTFVVLKLQDSFASQLFLQQDWGSTQIGRLQSSQLHRFSEFLNNEYCGEIWRLKREIIFLDIVFSAWEQSKRGVVTSAGVVHHPSYDRMMKVRSYVIDNIEGRLTINCISNSFGMSAHQLRHCYMQVFGQSLPSFIKEVRMNEAKKLLCNTSKAITEIAWELGFESVAGFSRSFYKYFQLTPENVRLAVEQ